MSLLSFVSFPLGLALSWLDFVVLIAKDDPFRAESVERVWGGAVPQEGLGEPVSVEGALGFRVACDEPLGWFGC